MFNDAPTPSYTHNASLHALDALAWLSAEVVLGEDRKITCNCNWLNSFSDTRDSSKTNSDWGMMVWRNWSCLIFWSTNSLKLCRRPFISNLLKEELRLCILCWIPALEHRIAMLRHRFPRGFALRSRLALPIRCYLAMPAMPQTDVGLGIPDALPEWKKMPTMEDCVGETPLVRLQRMVPRDSKSMVLCKLEGLKSFALLLEDLPDSLNRLCIQLLVVLY